MKKLLLWTALCALSAFPLMADFCPLISVDENGSGALDFAACGGVITPLHGVLAPDPGPGGLPSVLTYDLLGPPSLTAGDVFLQDGAGGPILDVVRFNPAGTGGPGYQASLLFYSDNVDGSDSIGDTPSPPGAFYANTITIQEVGVEGDDGATYTPLAGQPGFVAGFSVTYDLISDGALAPEPSSWALMILGAGALVSRKVFRKRPAA